MIRIGIDLGGTKIATVAFAADWSVMRERSVVTPKSYPELLVRVVKEIRWATGDSPDASIGICVPGFASNGNGVVVSANCCIDGHDFGADLSAAVGTQIYVCNDAAAVAISEAVFGAGRSFDRVASVTFGTGIGGGMSICGTLPSPPLSIACEVGHMPAPARVTQAHNLPLFECGCGRVGCFETYASGRGLAAVASHFAGRLVMAEDVIAHRGVADWATRAWAVWVDVTIELLRLMVLAYDPEVIVIGGGLSRIEGLLDDLQGALDALEPQSVPAPTLKLAEGGPASGAMGAAHLAMEAQR